MRNCSTTVKAASISEIKKELSYLESGALTELCLRLAKYKKENKELLTYLLFEAHDEAAYIAGIKQEIDQLFEELPPKNNLYQTKKSLRKILRIANKHIKYSSVKRTEVELRVFFCTKLKDSGIKIQLSTVLMNLYNQQLKKINEVLESLPEDLQSDYQQEIEYLS
jgi:hypothetical protein